MNFGEDEDIKFPSLQILFVRLNSSHTRYFMLSHKDAQNPNLSRNLTVQAHVQEYATAVDSSANCELSTYVALHFTL